MTTTTERISAQQYKKLYEIEFLHAQSGETLEDCVFGEETTQVVAAAVRNIAYGAIGNPITVGNGVTKRTYHGTLANVQQGVYRIISPNEDIPTIQFRYPSS